MKKCNKCQEILPFERFTKSQRRKDGHRDSCKECASLAERLRTYENKARRAKPSATDSVDKVLSDLAGLSGCVFCREGDPCCVWFYAPWLPVTKILTPLSKKSSESVIAQCTSFHVLCHNCKAKVENGVLGTPLFKPLSRTYEEVREVPAAKERERIRERSTSRRRPPRDMPPLPKGFLPRG